MPITLHIIQEDIDKALEHERTHPGTDRCANCVVSQAAMRQFKKAAWTSPTARVDIGHTRNSFVAERSFQGGPDLYAYILRVDNREPVSPQSFTLNEVTR